jgi:hypothetical protein
MLLLADEITNALNDRGIRSNWQQFRRYTASRLEATAGPYPTSEITGNCRLSWYDHLMRDPLRAAVEAERFTRELHTALCGDHCGLDRALAIARAKMDCGSRPPREFVAVRSPEEALEAVKRALAAARCAHARALAPLAPRELNDLWTNLYPVTTAQSEMGHTLPDRATGRRMCDLLEKIDRSAIFDAVDALVPLTDRALLAQLAALPEDGDIQLEGVTGKVVREIVTPAGKIVIGGKGNNVYHLDKMKDVNVVIDLGGDDTYYEGTCNLERPVLIIIDLKGNDVYRGSHPGIQGGAVLGISMLLDVEGDDVYEAADVAQGSCLGGAGILIDYAGNDRYRGTKRVQGQALGGVGILLDRAGNDDYHAALWAQGFGGPLGFGLLEDIQGKDHYYVGGAYRNSYYPETPGYEGWGQGVGAGIRQCACGGIGVLLDGGGDDVYEFDYMGHGGGYWLGLGFARDFAGNDRRLGATLRAFDGGPRTQERFQRFGTGFGCHYAMGFCFDDEGNDTYDGTIMGLGFGWDLSLGVLCDFAGNDRYEATGGGTQGNGAEGSIGILFDCDGDDVYLGYGQGYANPNVSYHPASECGGNFSFLIDWGGKNTFGSGASNNGIYQRGAPGGFLIARPKREPARQEAKKHAAPGATAGS